MSELDTAASSMIVDHSFDAPRWWQRCSGCGFSMAAHDRMTERTRRARAEALAAHDHRCPACVQLDHDRVDKNNIPYRVHADCPHRWEG